MNDQTRIDVEESNFPKDALLGAFLWTLLPGVLLLVCYIGYWTYTLTELLALTICIYGFVGEVLACILIAGIDWELRQCRRAFEYGDGSLRRLRRSGSGLRINHRRVEEPIIFKLVRGVDAAHRHGVQRDVIPSLIDAIVGELEICSDRIRTYASMLPSLGLLGTVVGIVILTTEISYATDGGEEEIVDAIRAAISGMSTALVTTFAGSLFGSIALSGLASHADRLIARLREELEALGNLIHFGKEWGHGDSRNA
ncbi:MAG: MotA/TolQ/ExbB proton channel family protein [Fuerstiella sp.]